MGDASGVETGKRTARCPHCGWPEAVEAEEYGIAPEGVLAQAIFVCPNCKQSFQRARWTRTSWERALPFVLAVIGLAMGFHWVVLPALDSLRSHINVVRGPS